MNSGTKWQARFATVVFDVDSTIASIEGIDWLAERRNAEIAAQCIALTTSAMAGEMPFEHVYTRRLELIRPTQVDLNALADAYLESVAPRAAQLIKGLQAVGTTVLLVSGGLHAAIAPLARLLAVPAKHVHAVHVLANANGEFVMLDGVQPLTTQQGKPHVISQLNLERPTVMIGDGATDAAARGVVDTFIAYTGIARRESVVAVADATAHDFVELVPLLLAIVDPVEERI